MNDQTNPKPSEESEVEVEEAEAADPAPEAETEEQMAELLAENADLKDRLLRAAAEMENIRRRNEREAADARQYAVTAFAGDLLSVADNLVRALEAVPPEARSGDSPVAALFSGVEMTEREFLRILDKHGVKKFDPAGTKFDPHRHQAMFEVEDGNVDPGTVVQVVQAGYTIGDRVLRPAFVGVSKAAKKVEPAPPEPETAKEVEAPSMAPAADEGDVADHN